jgi:hypothetical protein
MSTNSSSTDITAVPGLTTSQLNSGEQTTTTTTPNNKPPQDPESNKVSVFDIALDIENSLNDVLAMVEKHDHEINERIEKLVNRIGNLEQNARNDI